jgi:hypothetical protein
VLPSIMNSRISGPRRRWRAVRRVMMSAMPRLANPAVMASAHAISTATAGIHGRSGLAPRPAELVEHQPVSRLAAPRLTTVTARRLVRVCAGWLSINVCDRTSQCAVAQRSIHARTDVETSKLLRPCRPGPPRTRERAGPVSSTPTSHRSLLVMPVHPDHPRHIANPVSSLVKQDDWVWRDDPGRGDR